MKKKLEEVRLLESRKSARLMDQDTDFARLADMAGDRKRTSSHSIDVPSTQGYVLFLFFCRPRDADDYVHRSGSTQDLFKFDVTLTTCLLAVKFLRSLDHEWTTDMVLLTRIASSSDTNLTAAGMRFGQEPIPAVRVCCC